MQLKWIFIPTLTLLFDDDMVFSASDFSLLHSRRGADNKQKPEPDPFKTMESLNEKKWFLKNRASNTPPPLLGFQASCLEMEIFSVEEDSKSALMMLYYKDSNNVRQSELLNVTAKRSATGPTVLVFRFEDPINPNLTGRAVEYSVIDTDFTSCYILKTSTEKECTFWILDTADDGKSPKECTPLGSPDCVKEVYGLHETTQCSDSNTVDVLTRKPENPITPSDSTTPSSSTTPRSPTTPSSSNDSQSCYRSQVRRITCSTGNSKNKNIYLRYKSSHVGSFSTGISSNMRKDGVHTKQNMTQKSAVLTMDYKYSNKEWQTEVGKCHTETETQKPLTGKPYFFG
uniref:Putative secreted mucin n=1 Tax=Ixodes ricinus TaxID=34613 RepID=A0A090XEU3_IXORI